MDGAMDKATLLRRLLDRAGRDPKYRDLLTVAEQVTEFMRDNPSDPDVVAYRDAEPSPPADLDQLLQPPVPTDEADS